MTNELTGKKILVIGLGRSGVAAARYCAKAGSRVVVTDLKTKDELSGAVSSLGGFPIEFVLGGHDRALFSDADVVVTSPGVPVDLPGISFAREKGVPVIGEMELAVRSIDRPIVAITGTNGKTTTTALIGHLLGSAGVKACVAGNIGTPILDVLDEAARAEFVVLEVSSFQIETTPSIRPHIAIFLNASPDHLDRHSTFEAYVECKAKLLKRVSNSGWGIYNIADEAVARSVSECGCRLVPFDAIGRLLGKRHHGAGGWFSGGELKVSATGSEPTRYPLRGVALEGAHNRENMLAALLAAELCNASPSRLKEGLESFKGLPHRLELVGEHQGVRFYDDSKGTNIGATMRAIEGFAEPIVLIAGGLSKGVDFAPLGPHMNGRVKKVVLIGEAAPAMDAAFRDHTETARASSMDDAVTIAAEAAQPGDVILLSPACASFDMFRDYAHRGEVFVKAVRKIMGVDS